MGIGLKGYLIQGQVRSFSHVGIRVSAEVGASCPVSEPNIGVLHLNTFLVPGLLL